MPQTRKQARRERARLELVRRATEGVALSEPPKVLLDLPNEILVMIAKLCVHQTTYSHGPCTRVLMSLSATCRRLRSISIPTLFRETVIADRFSSSIDLIHRSLRFLVQNPEILEAIRHLTFRARRNPSLGPYHPETPKLLLECLRSMPKLEEVRIQFFHGGIHYLVPLITSHLVYRPKKTSLQGVTTLHLSSGMPLHLAKGLLKMFPCVRNLAVHVECITHSSVLQLAGKANLAYVKVSRDKKIPRSEEDYAPGWSKDSIQEVARLIPGVPHLALVGYLEDVMLTQIVEHFKRFTNLEQLDVTDEQVVDEETAMQFLEDMGSDAFHDLSDGSLVMDDPEDAAYMFAEDHPLNEDRREVSKAFFEKLPTLKRMCLSRQGYGELFEPVRDRDGKVMRVTKVSESSCYGGSETPKPSGKSGKKKVQVEWYEGFPLVGKLRGQPGAS